MPRTRGSDAPAAAVREVLGNRDLLAFIFRFVPLRRLLPVRCVASAFRAESDAAIWMKAMFIVQCFKARHSGDARRIFASLVGPMPQARDRCVALALRTLGRKLLTGMTDVRILDALFFVSFSVVADMPQSCATAWCIVDQLPLHSSAAPYKKSIVPFVQQWSLRLASPELLFAQSELNALLRFMKASTRIFTLDKQNLMLTHRALEMMRTASGHPKYLAADDARKDQYIAQMLRVCCEVKGLSIGPVGRSVATFYAIRCLGLVRTLVRLKSTPVIDSFRSVLCGLICPILSPMPSTGPPRSPE